MSSNSPSITTSSTPTTVSVSAYLNYAPPQSNEFTPEEIKSLVLEYLCNSCYADSAKAFVQELQTRNELELAEKGNINSSIDSVINNGSGKNGIIERKKGKESSRLTTIRQESLVDSNGNSRSSSSSGMEGIESTPPPMSQPEEIEVEKKGVEGDDIEMNDVAEDDDEEDELEEDLEVESNLRSNGKSVAFSNGEQEEGIESEGWPGLTKEDLRLVRLRRDIRDDILSGRIQRAVDLLTEHFPTVLSATPQLLPLVDACLPEAFFISTTSSGSSSASSSSLTLPRSQVPILGTTFTPSALSLSPEILSLNLQLQSFVELIRTANATSTPSTPTHPSTLSDSPPPSTSNGGMSSSMSSIISTRTNSMMKAIGNSQALGAKVKELPSGKVKEDWERECVDVSGLLAYTDLNICPVRGYLAQERRETLAELVNAAILKSQNKTAMPVLALAARQTTAIWSALAEWKHPFPPGATAVKSKIPKTVGRFDLKAFLQEGESSLVELK